MLFSKSLYKCFLPQKTFISVWICQLKSMSFLLWPETSQVWPSMTQIKNLCHSCWFWARRLSGNAFIQDSHLPISASAVLVFRFHRQLTGWWFSPSCLPLIYDHNQGILVRYVLWIGRQNAGCHICSTPRFSSSHRRHLQVTADPLWPMIWDHTTSICHLQ